MDTFYLGIDVAKAKLDCALRLTNGKYKNKVVENSPQGFKSLGEWLTKQQATLLHVCMEATGVYWEAAAEYLVDRGMIVSVVNPVQIKAFGNDREGFRHTQMPEFAFKIRPHVEPVVRFDNRVLRGGQRGLDGLGHPHIKLAFDVFGVCIE